MTDKERLEEIKVKYNAGKLGEFIDLKLVNPYDLKYLIERVQELEEENIGLKQDLKDVIEQLESVSDFVQESDCIHCNGKGFNGLDYCSQCNQGEVNSDD